MGKKEFYEVQKFRQKWLWILLLIIPSSMIFKLIKWSQAQEDIFANASHLFIIGSYLFVFLLFIFSRLKTKINKSGIYFRFLPFHYKFHEIKWIDVKRAYVRQYDPISEYGGWGLRLGLFGKGKAYNTMGDMGLQLELNDGKKILFGTQKPKDIEQALEVFYLKNNQES